MNIRTLGIDLATNVFRVHGVDSQGNRSAARAAAPAVAILHRSASTCLVGMEASGGAPLGARDGQARARRQGDDSAVRPPLCKVEQE
jgi:transposase